MLFLFESRTLMNPTSRFGTMFQHWMSKETPAIIAWWGKQFAGRNISNMDIKRHRGGHYTVTMNPDDHSPNNFATAVRSECRVSLVDPPARIEEAKGCVKTYALLVACPDVTDFLRDLLDLIDLGTSPASPPFSTIDGTLTWNSEVTELTSTARARRITYNMRVKFCVQRLSILSVRDWSGARALLWPFLRCYARQER